MAQRRYRLLLGSPGAQMLCLSQTCPPTGPQEALESRVQDRDPSPIPACYQLEDSAHHHATAPRASVSPSVKGGHALGC